MARLIIQVISSLEGGGAELLVRYLHKSAGDAGRQSQAVYFVGDKNKLNKGEFVISNKIRSFSNIIKLRKHIKYAAKRHDNVIVHAHLAWPFYFVAIACIGLNVRLVYTEHNTVNKRRSIPFFAIFEKFVYLRYQKIICISDGVYSSLSAWLNNELYNRIVTIPNGARLLELKERSVQAGEKINLVSIGSLTKKKNFETSILSISLLKDIVGHYTIIGDGPLRSNLETVIKENNLSDYVTIAGWKDNIEKFLHAADIQLVPSLWEGFGLVAVEGLSTGLPIVASDVDGLREVVNKDIISTVSVSDMLSPESWAAGVRVSVDRLVTHGADEIAKESRKQAEKFSLKTMADRYIKLYEDMV